MLVAEIRRCVGRLEFGNDMAADFDNPCAARGRVKARDAFADGDKEIRGFHSVHRCCAAELLA